MKLIVGKEYRRTALHQAFGGQRQSGISTSRQFPLLLLFSGESGTRYGYEDGPQPDGSYWYTGEGQIDDMEMVRGNAAIRDAEKGWKGPPLL